MMRRIDKAEIEQRAAEMTFSELMWCISGCHKSGELAERFKRSSGWYGKTRKYYETVEDIYRTELLRRLDEDTMVLHLIDLDEDDMLGDGLTDDGLDGLDGSCRI